MDKNGDNKIQYVLLQGDKNNLETRYRSACVIRTINQKGLQSSEIASEFCNWDKDCARVRLESLFLRYGDTIEVIISNNDEMALGAIMALQGRGYNMGDHNKYIPVVGIDGIDEVKKLIKSGAMTGTVIQDDEGMGRALYIIGMNLVEGKEPLTGTKYKFDSTGVSIRIPYKGYITKK
jgi:methyl-galactoside transport system substrate-binding protein